MIFEVTRLQLHTTPYLRENTQEQIMNKMSYHRSRSSSNQRKPSGKRNHITGENQQKFTKSGTSLPRWKPPTMEDSLAAEHDMEDPEDD